MSAPDFQPSSVRPTRGGGPARYRKPLFLLLALALLLGLARIGDQYIPQAALWIEGLGFWGPAATTMTETVTTAARTTISINY